ncbi:MAG TPA: hypothetical protein VFF27_02300 [Bacteroidia bacterium]|jgi:hypothetical protein|nr:hypothetical protein [Bacteroidia bacterium]
MQNTLNVSLTIIALFLITVNLNATLVASDDSPNGVEKNSFCPTDINKDGIVNNADLSLLLLKFGQSCNCCREDINRDGVVNTQDLSLLLLDFNNTCRCIGSDNISASEL